MHMVEYTFVLTLYLHLVVCSLISARRLCTGLNVGVAVVVDAEIDVVVVAGGDACSAKVLAEGGKVRTGHELRDKAGSLKH